jgi:hypothetical protein
VSFCAKRRWCDIGCDDQKLCEPTGDDIARRIVGERRNERTRNLNDIAIGRRLTMRDAISFQRSGLRIAKQRGDGTVQTEGSDGERKRGNVIDYKTSTSAWRGKVLGGSHGPQRAAQPAEKPNAIGQRGIAMMCYTVNT